jgi:hypothetical protein
MNKFKRHILNQFKKNKVVFLNTAGAIGLFFLIILSLFLNDTGKIFQEYSKYILSKVLPDTVIEITNEEREKHSLNSLSRNPLLDQAALLKAEHMKENQYFAHYSPEDSISPWYWFEKVGYEYVNAGENLAIYFNESKDVVEAWMDSPLHRDNILKDNYTEIGVAVVQGIYQDHETSYVVQLFGTPNQTQLPESSSTQQPEFTDNNQQVDEKNVQGVEINLNDQDFEEIVSAEEGTISESISEENELEEFYAVYIENNTTVKSVHLATSSPLLEAVEEDIRGEASSVLKNNTGLNLFFLFLSFLVGIIFIISISYAFKKKIYSHAVFSLVLFSSLLVLIYTHFTHIVI